MSHRLSTSAAVLTFAALLLACAASDAPRGQDWEDEYEALITDFRSSLEDTTALEAVEERADSLSDRIRRFWLDNRDHLATTTFLVDYETNDPERPVGTGSAICESYSVMSGLFNTRDRELEGLELLIQAYQPVRGGCA